MMSQIVMSIAISPSPFGFLTVISFFETFAPSVEMYRSSNWSWMNRRMSAVLPTAPSPTKHTFTFIRCTSAMLRPIRLAVFQRDGGCVYKEICGPLYRLISRRRRRLDGPHDAVRERAERLFHVQPGLGRRERVRGAVRVRDRRQLRLLDDDLRAQVRLVTEEDEGHVPSVRPDHVDPAVQVRESVAAGQVAHRQDPVRALEVRLLQELPEALLAHDVPDHEVEDRRSAPPRARHGFLRDLRTDRRDVPVVERVQDEALDEARLAHADVPDQARLRLHMPRRSVRRPLHYRPGATEAGI